MSINSTNSDTSVLLSVIVISISTHESLKVCLDSILASKGENKVEIIIVDDYENKNLPELRNAYPDVLFLQLTGKSGIPVLAAAGIRHCSGDILAMTDSSCTVDANWITSILKAHKSSSPVIGGAVEISDHLNLLDLAAYFCEYGQFMYPLKPGAAQELPGNNISFKASALKIGSQDIGDEFWKTRWCSKLQKEGIDLIAEPSILVYYRKNFKLKSFLKRRFHHGRCFAGLRTDQTNFFKRFFFAGGSIFLPFIFLLRTVRVIFIKKRLLKEFLLTFPFIVLTIVSWSLGETCGYLFGSVKSYENIY